MRRLWGNLWESHGGWGEGRSRAFWREVKILDLLGGRVSIAW